MTSPKFPTSPIPAEFCQGAPANAELSPPAPATAPASVQPVVGASFKQLDYLTSLLAEREIEEAHRADMKARVDRQRALNEANGDCAMTVDGVSKKRASDWIGRLLEKPKGLRPTRGSRGFQRFPVRFETMELDGGKTMELGFVGVDGREVPQGKYALDVGDLDWTNEIAFFNLYVARGEDGPFYSLKMYVSDDLVKMSAENQREVLTRISLDPAAASKLYGQHKVRCGVCNRKLTNDLSREIGIGPVCRERMSW